MKAKELKIGDLTSFKGRLVKVHHIDPPYYSRLEIDAHKYAQEFPNADDRMKRILESAFLMGEMFIVKKLLDNIDKKK